MEVVYERCCGLDVHKETIAACAVWIEGGQKHKQVRRFGTMTADLLAMGDWLRSLGIRQVAMESTGVYWKPVWNVLEGEFELLLVNARHMRQVPGRKTDVKDCEWIADLLQHGLLRGSFVPEPGQRDLRELTRYRARLSDDRGRVASRVEKVLEDANIKLAAVATDVLGASGRAMLEAMVAGEQDAGKLAEMAQRGLRQKLPELRAALSGRLREHHRFLLRELLDELRYLDGKLATVERRIEQQMRPFERAVSLWDSIPGINRVTAWSLVAEIGADLKPFASAEQLASWAGMCPGNHESAGQQKSGKTRRGNRWLRRVLSQAAWGAARTKNTYLAARFRRLAARRGRKRAVVAVGHTLLRLVYWLLKYDQPYRDLGGDYFDRLRPERLTRSLVQRLQRLGYQVNLSPAIA